VARNKKFWAKPRTRTYRGQSRKVNKACWIGPDGLPDSAEREDWTLKEALDFAGEQWMKVHSGTFAKKSSATMDAAIELRTKDLEERRELTIRGVLHGRQSVSGAYLKSQMLLHETTLSPMFGSLHPSEVDKRFIERWARQVLLDGVMTPDKINYAFKRVSILLDHAHDQQWIPFNPLRKAKAKLPEVKPADVIVPEDDDMVAMLRTIEPDYCEPGDSEVLFSSMRMAIFLVAFAGMRPNEASALRWEDVDLARMEINQHRGFTSEEGHKLRGKTRASTRLIDILPQLHAELLAYQRRTAEITPQEGRLVTWRALAERNANPDSGLVLCNAYMGTLAPSSIGIHWRKLREPVTERDLSKITLYSLRHYAGSIWLRDGMSTPRVSAMMGHKNIEFTQQVYVKVLRELDEDRLRGMRQIGSGIDRRYRALGLELASTPVPVLDAQQSLVQIASAAPAIVANPIEQSTAAVTTVPTTLAEMREAIRLDVLAMFDAGMAPSVIARKTGVSGSTVRNYIDDRDTDVACGPSKWDEDATTKEARYAEARRLAEEEGLSYREIGLKLGIKVGALRGYANRHGWKAARKPVRYNPGEYKLSAEERARQAEHQRRHRERKRLIEAGLEIPPELQVQTPVAKPKPPKAAPKPKLGEEERRAHDRESKRRYKLSDRGRAKGRADRKKHWARKRAAAKTVEVVCACGRTFLRPYKPGKPRTKCEVCSPPTPDRNARRREERRRLRQERELAIGVAAK
jgi:integrase/DNA invertase Pin-like site-specific DNA recombinase